MHPGQTGTYLAVFTFAVISIPIQLFQEQPQGPAIGAGNDLNLQHGCLRFIFRNCHHSIIRVIFRAGSKPVIVSLVEYRTIEAVCLQLGGNENAFFFRKFANIQFIAKAARNGHFAAGIKGSDSSVYMTGAAGNMGTHRAKRICQSGSLLNAQTVNRFSVVARPYLRAVVQHPGIKPPTASN